MANVVVVLVLLMVCSPTGSAPIGLIIDTDIGGGGCIDVDDVGAICMANALADKGEVELLAIIQDTIPLQPAGAISVLNSYYGRERVPIGAYKGAGLNASSAPLLPYINDLVMNWPSPIKNTSQVPDGFEVYRRVLAAQEDRSVVISSIGLLTNLAALLRSGADDHSPLDGRELIAKKVKLIAVMGGEFPGGSDKPKGCNFCGCAFEHDAASVESAAAAAAYVFSNMPPEVRILFSGASVGAQVPSGGALSTCAPAQNPCRQAYLDYLADPPKGPLQPPGAKTRPSWDPLTTLAAVRGATAAGCAECSDCDGTVWINASTGANKWISGTPSNQTYLLLRNAKIAAAAIDALLCQPPRHMLAVPPPSNETPRRDVLYL